MPWAQTEGGSKVGIIGAFDEDYCDVCGAELPKNEFAYDARTKNGRWAWMCQDCFDRLGVGLGLGKGQKYEWRD